jgi:type VI protein secretion system component Hcp
MRFVLEGRPVLGECRLAIAPNDTLMADFQATRPFPNFFEVTDFDFAIALKESDDGKSSTGAGSFARWRSAAPSEYKDIKYPLEFDKFTFSRQIDRASPVFFQGCCTSQTFDTAVLVKRLSQGALGGVMRPAVAYMRVEFSNVLITGIDWADGDVVTERCEFICRQMQVTLRQQTTDGGVSGANESRADWPSKTQDRSLNILGKGKGWA